MNLPAQPGRAQLTERLVVELGAAFQQRAVYAPGHPQVERAIARAIGALSAWCAHEAVTEVSLILVEGQLLVEREAIPEEIPWTRGLLQTFRRYDIRGLTLVLGLDTRELGTFFDSCQSAAGPTPSSHVQLGQAGFAAGEVVKSSAAVGVPARGAPDWLTREQMEAARAELVAAANGATTRFERLRELVVRLARTAESGALEPLRLAAAEIAERAFVHGLAVALGTLRLGRALGARGDALDELALAGFLHDVGFLEAGAPEEDPDERRRLHPVRGAARLAVLEGIPEVAVVVAYEHHLRFDREANYPPMTEPRPPIAAARVVAVADTWETLRSQGGLPHDEALAALRGRAGTYLDPVLVDLFVTLILPAGDETRA